MTSTDLKMTHEGEQEADARSDVKRFLEGADPVFQIGVNGTNEVLIDNLMEALKALGAGEFTNIRGANGQTVLHAIVTKNADKPHEITILSAELIQAISGTAGFDYYELLTVQDNEGFTALQRASMEGYVDLLKTMRGPLT